MRSLNDELHTVPLVLSLVLLFIGQPGFEISVWPYIVPRFNSIWDMQGAFSLSVLKSTEREIEYGICNSKSEFQRGAGSAA